MRLLVGLLILTGVSMTMKTKDKDKLKQNTKMAEAKVASGLTS